MTNSTLDTFCLLSILGFLGAFFLTVLIKRFYDNFIAVALMRKRIKATPEIYKNFIKLCDEIEKQQNRCEFICSRQREQEKLIDDYYENKKYFSQKILKEKEQEVEKRKEFLSYWETLRQNATKKQICAEEKMKEYAKFYEINIKNVDKIRQAIV